MKIEITAYEYLDPFLEILNDYNFEPKEYIGYRRYEYENLVRKGTIEIENLEELFALSKKLHLYLKKERR